MFMGPKGQKKGKKKAPPFGGAMSTEKIKLKIYHAAGGEVWFSFSVAVVVSFLGVVTVVIIGL